MESAAPFFGFRWAAVASSAARYGVLLGLICGFLQAQSAERDLRPGLVGTCRDSRHGIQMVAPSPSFLLSASESIHPALETSFECEWRGTIEILQGGLYRFDRSGTRLWLGAS